MDEHSVSRVDVMKVALEGAELMLFAEQENLLERTDAPLILYEGFRISYSRIWLSSGRNSLVPRSCGYTLLLLNSETGEISELKPDYRYDSMVIAVKPSHPAYERLRGVAR